MDNVRGRVLRRPAGGPVGFRHRVEVGLRRIDRRRAAALVLAAVAAFVVQATLASARATVSSLGTRSLVPVVSRQVVAGDTIGPADVNLESWPVGLIPVGVSATSPVGRMARADLAVGEVVVESRLVSSTGPIDADERGVTIPIPIGSPPVEIGDRVELIGTRATALGVQAVVLTAGRVMARSEDGITIAAPTAGALAVVAHLGQGSVDVVLTPLR